MESAEELGGAVVHFLESGGAVNFLDAVCGDVHASLLDCAHAFDVGNRCCERAAYLAVIIVCDEIDGSAVDGIVAYERVCVSCRFKFRFFRNVNVLGKRFERIIVGRNRIRRGRRAEMSFSVDVVKRKAGLVRNNIVYTIYKYVVYISFFLVCQHGVVRKTFLVEHGCVAVFVVNDFARFVPEHVDVLVEEVRAVSRLNCIAVKLVGDDAVKLIRDVALRHVGSAVVHARAEVCRDDDGSFNDVCACGAGVLSELIVAYDCFTVLVCCTQHHFVDDDIDVVAHLLSCKRTACDHFEAIFVSAHHSVGRKHDGYIRVSRAVVHFVFDVKVVFDEGYDFSRHSHRAENLVVFDDAFRNRADGVITFRTRVSRTENLIVCKQGLVSCFNPDFESADEHVVHLVGSDVCVGHTVARKRVGHAACVVGEVLQFALEVDCVLFGDEIVARVLDCVDARGVVVFFLRKGDVWHKFCSVYRHFERSRAVIGVERIDVNRVVVVRNESAHAVVECGHGSERHVVIARVCALAHAHKFESDGG